MTSDENTFPKARAPFDTEQALILTAPSLAGWSKRRELRALAISVLTHLPRKSCWNQLPGMLQISAINSAKDAICSCPYSFGLVVY